jgi:elongator complex protein 3
VELGVQTLNDDVLMKVNRGHTSLETRTATRLLKDAGLKVCYHIMPNLPGMTPAADLEVFQDIFEHAEYRPDMIKIYPTLVVKGTDLYESWLKKEYEPYSLDDTIELIAKLKSAAPRWVRIQRVQRDIPAKLIEAGVRNSNLRQLVQNRLRELGEKCSCIRCREIGHNLAGEQKPDEDSFRLRTDTYDASGGKEAFLSVEDTTNDLLIGFIRLRFPGSNIIKKTGQPALPDGTEELAFVRELKVFGQLAPFDPEKDIGARSTTNGKGKEKIWQHKGIGKTLMDAAEEYARENWDIRTILVNSGVGARLYYPKLGYASFGHYMIKTC